MPDIFHDFPINVSPKKVFDAISTPQGLDSWWSKRSAGKAAEGQPFELWFGPEFDWRAMVTRCVPYKEFEFTIAMAHKDWIGTKVEFLLADKKNGTQVRFYHAGWPELNEHYRISCIVGRCI